jgi:hypothetical protein
MAADKSPVLHFIIVSSSDIPVYEHDFIPVSGRPVPSVCLPRAYRVALYLCDGVLSLDQASRVAACRTLAAVPKSAMRSRTASYVATWLHGCIAAKYGEGRHRLGLGLGACSAHCMAERHTLRSRYRSGVCPEPLHVTVRLLQCRYTRSLLLTDNFGMLVLHRDACTKRCKLHQVAQDDRATSVPS